MKLFTGREREERPVEPGAAIKLGVRAPEEAAQAHWGLILVIFMRVLAVLWICQGLAEWALVLVPEKSVLEALPAAMAAAVIFFRDRQSRCKPLVYGSQRRGGGALWLFAASAQIFIAIAIRNSISMVWVGIDIALILVYFFLTFNASRSAGRYAD